MPIKNRQKRKIGEEQKAITLFKLSKKRSMNQLSSEIPERQNTHTKKKKINFHSPYL